MFRIMFLVIFTLCVFSNCNEKTHSNQMAKSSKVYTIISQEVHDSEKYSQYRANIKKVSQKHGGRLIREFSTPGKPIDVIPYGTTNRMLLLSWDSPDGFKNFLSDPEYTHRILKLKSFDVNHVLQGMITRYSETSNLKCDEYIKSINT